MEKEADLKAAVTRAEAELATALDVGGQVYMFGRGVAGQFAAKPVRPDMFGFDRIKEMWRKRLSLDPAGVRCRAYQPAVRGLRWRSVSEPHHKSCTRR